MQPAIWSQYKNFKKEEFNCKHTGKNEMKHEFMLVLQKLRDAYGKPIVITSGFRDKTHPVERNKTTTGTHVQGIACDIRINDGSDLYELVELALQIGFTGLGIGNRTGHKMLHLDIRKTTPVIWSY